MAYATVTKKDGEPQLMTWQGKPLRLPYQQLQYIVRILRENVPENVYEVKQEGEK